MMTWFDESFIGSPFSELDYLLEDSNEDDMTLDTDDGPDDVDTQSTDNSNENNSSEDTSSTEEESGDDNQTEENDNEDNNTEEFGDDDMNLDPDSDESTEGGEENPDGESGEGEGTDDSMGDDSTGSEEIDENDPNAKLKELEKSIFDQLSKEQKALKTKELKSLYDIVYNKCTDIINTISGAERSPEQAKVYDYVMNSLADLQKYIKDYLMQIFDSKTYIENMVQLQKYLTVLDTVSNIFEEVKKSSSTEQ